MNAAKPNPGDERLTSLLRKSRPVPGLPPRFQANVWRRIESNERPVAAMNWLEMLAALVSKPRFAVASVCALLLAGALFGSLNGTAHAKQDAQERYLARVAIPVTP